MHFPSVLAKTINFPGTCIDPNNTTTNCPFNVLLSGRTWTFLNGGQYGAWDVIDGNGYVYTPSNAATCSGDNNGLHPCNDMVMFGTGHNGFVGPGVGDISGCGGGECVDGGQLSASCRSAAGVLESCAGHTLVITIYTESNGKADYTGAGSQGFPEQAMSWFDGVQVSIPYYPGGNVISSNAASGDWHCSPGGDSNNTLYNSPCPA